MAGSLVLPAIAAVLIGVLLRPSQAVEAGPAYAEADLADGLLYSVRRGDSLYRISLVFGVSIDEIVAANQLAGPNAIYPGLRLLGRGGGGGVGVGAGGGGRGGGGGGRAPRRYRTDHRRRRARSPSAPA
ncbi:MAG: LysM peptidoglycan-binding domain-containing protein, partial [Chloroflexi bacterium]|nr:LysM peptidoglycan-binding domain-containing protein [Chloroflexota bacterium]